MHKINCKRQPNTDIFALKNIPYSTVHMTLVHCMLVTCMNHFIE